MNQNEQQIVKMLQDFFPELFYIQELLTKGHINAAELVEVIHKMAIIRTSDDGFGKILLEMQRKPGGNWLRIRTIQDKVLKMIPEEELI